MVHITPRHGLYITIMTKAINVTDFVSCLLRSREMPLDYLVKLIQSNLQIVVDTPCIA
mgnify:CR=1 FL=1